MTNFKIKACLDLPTGRSHTGDFIAHLHRLTHLFEQTLVMPIDAQIILPMIDDEQITKPAQPIRKDHLARCNGLDWAALTGANDDAPPRPAIGTLSPKTPLHAPLSGHGCPFL